MPFDTSPAVVLCLLDGPGATGRGHDVCGEPALSSWHGKCDHQLARAPLRDHTIRMGRAAVAPTVRSFNGSHLNICCNCLETKLLEPMESASLLARSPIRSHLPWIVLLLEHTGAKVMRGCCWQFRGLGSIYL